MVNEKSCALLMPCQPSVSTALCVQVIPARDLSLRSTNRFDNPRGAAMVIALIMLATATMLSMAALRSSATELLISRYAGDTYATGYTAESGVETVLSWVALPEQSPNSSFFRALSTTVCVNEQDNPDFLIESPALDAFVPSLGGVSAVTKIMLYKSVHAEGVCRVESWAITGFDGTKGVKTDLTRGPMKPVTAGLQAEGDPQEINPYFVHWGTVKYFGDLRLPDDLSVLPATGGIPSAIPYSEPGPNEDPWFALWVDGTVMNASGPNGGPFPSNVHPNTDSLQRDDLSMDAVKPFAKQYGEYYQVSPDGMLEYAGVSQGSFDDLFGQVTENHRLVYIERKAGYSNDQPLYLQGGPYRGYFFIEGEVIVGGGQTGMTVEGASPPWPTVPQAMTLTDIHLDGLLYAEGNIELQDRFAVYGALITGQQFTGLANALEVWYNHDYESATYSSLPILIPIKETWNDMEEET